MVGANPEVCLYLYHYTGRGALFEILRTCIIRPSHAAWGSGVYLTDVAPLAANRREVSLVFGRRRFYAERLEAYVRVDREKADAEPYPGAPRVFIASGRVSIAGAPIEIGLWQGGDDPQDQAGWKAEVFTACAPDIEELQRVFESVLP